MSRGEPARPRSPWVKLPAAAPAPRVAALRRARYSSLRPLHLGLWWVVERPPTDIAAVLFGSRSSVDRTRRANRQGSLGGEPDEQGWLMPPVRPPVLLPTL
jgi:hypothetical protein